MSGHTNVGCREFSSWETPFCLGCPGNRCARSDVQHAFQLTKMEPNIKETSQTPRNYVFPVASGDSLNGNEFSRNPPWPDKNLPIKIWFESTEKHHSETKQAESIYVGSPGTNRFVFGRPLESGWYVVLPPEGKYTVYIENRSPASVVGVDVVVDGSVAKLIPVEPNTTKSSTFYLSKTDDDFHMFPDPNQAAATRPVPVDFGTIKIFLHELVQKQILQDVSDSESEEEEPAEGAADTSTNGLPLMSDEPQYAPPSPMYSAGKKESLTFLSKTSLTDPDQSRSRVAHPITPSATPRKSKRRAPKPRHHQRRQEWVWRWFFHRPWIHPSDPVPRNDGFYLNLNYRAESWAIVAGLLPRKFDEDEATGSGTAEPNLRKIESEEDIKLRSIFNNQSYKTSCTDFFATVAQLHDRELSDYQPVLEHFSACNINSVEQLVSASFADLVATYLPASLPASQRKAIASLIQRFVQFVPKPVISIVIDDD
eukprot:TRINITY_DN10048_c0_g1_i1.p1 TRINITY_DN10048_c0_g1~~TRINITY_DN10048_c0_g1_i1.p1  ORF type:complete len:482 (+),score=88.11 TRINITY_DN10048_c0_g1_i1:518-1963(+)